jgi:hypothetical protein
MNNTGSIATHYNIPASVFRAAKPYSTLLSSAHLKMSGEGGRDGVKDGARDEYFLDPTLYPEGPERMPKRLRSRGPLENLLKPLEIYFLAPSNFPRTSPELPQKLPETFPRSSREPLELPAASLD